MSLAAPWLSAYNTRPAFALNMPLPSLPLHPPDRLFATPCAGSVLPILISLSGDAVLTDTAAGAVVAAWRSYLQRLRQDHPHTPIQIHSRFGTPVERLAGRVALAEGARLIAVLAGPPAEIAASLEPSARAEFAELLAQAETLPLAPADTSIDTAKDGALAAWLVRHCHLLVAIHDDEAREDATAKAIAFRQFSIPPELGHQRSLLDAVETGPILHLSPAAPAPAAARAVADAPGPELASHWRALEAYNAQISAHLPETSEAAPGSAATRLGERFIAIRRRWNISILGLGFLGALALQLYSTLGGKFPMADVYAVFFFMIGSLYFVGRQLHYNDRFVDYLVLAEGERIQAFWDGLGFAERVVEHFLPRHRRQLSWVCEALKRPRQPSPVTPECIASALRSWLDSLALETSAQHRQLARRARSLDFAVRFFYGISGLLSLWAFVYSGNAGGDLFDDLLVSAIGIVASFGTLLLIYNGAMDYAGRARMLAATLDVIEHAQALAGRKLPPHEVNELAIDIGRELLDHKTEWLLRQR